MRVLIAEDEAELARGLKYLLEKQKYTVDVARDGAEALDFYRSASYDAIVLDIMMPKKNGIQVLTEIRSALSPVPIMLLTAKAEVEDRVAGLNAGADDYLPKPFATSEFLARVGALVRRSSRDYRNDSIQFEDASLCRSTFELLCGGESIRLNNKEFQLADLFFRYPHVVFSTEQLMDRVWSLSSEAGIDVVWTYIGFLRKKLKSLGAHVEIRTIRGAGYSLEALK